MLYFYVKFKTVHLFTGLQYFEVIKEVSRILTFSEQNAIAKNR